MVRTKVNTEEKSVLQGDSGGFAVDMCYVAHRSVLGYKKRDFQFLPGLDKDMKDKTQLDLLGTSSLEQDLCHTVSGQPW